MNLKEYMLENRFIAYDDESKEEFKKLGTEFMYELSKKCNPVKSEHRYNRAGIAVSGDHTMVLEFPEKKFIYVSFNADCSSHLGILYRTMKHDKDYSGGSNNWCSWEKCDTLHNNIHDLIKKS